MTFDQMFPRLRPWVISRLWPVLGSWGGLCFVMGVGCGLWVAL